MSRKRKASFSSPFVDYQLDDLVNTNGGFFLEPGHTGATSLGGSGFDSRDLKARRPVNLAQEEQECAGIPCGDCEKLGVDPSFKRWFDVLVCKDCRLASPRFKMLTKTEAQDDYILTDSEIRSLKFIERPNPRNARYHDMKLYLKCQVEEFAFKKWGGEDKLDAEHVRREEERGAKKAKKFQKHLDELRKKAKRNPLQELSAAHKHEFGEEALDAATGKWTRACLSCSHSETYEKL